MVVAVAVGRAAEAPLVRRAGVAALGLATALLGAPGLGWGQGAVAPGGITPPTDLPGAATGGASPALPPMPRTSGDPGPDPTGAPTGTPADRPDQAQPEAARRPDAAPTLAPTPSTRPLAPMDGPTPRPGTAVR